MRIAFYAPLKPPDHPVPSGDRAMGQALIEALQIAGHEIRLASRFRSFDTGVRRRQERLRAIGLRLADRYASRAAAGSWRPDMWFTYHLYHKAPDWLGPAAAQALGIPYVVAEASFAPKQQHGRWDLGHRSVARALRQASCVLSLNPLDAPCVTPLLAIPDSLVAVPPFVDTAEFRPQEGGSMRQALAGGVGGDPAPPLAGPWLMTAAMMRHDQKLRSYRCLADALAQLTDLDWGLVIAGYGPAESEVRTLFARFGDRIVWIGAAAPERLRRLYRAADLFVWPAVKEAWGMVFLEAQACGTPVVAGRSGGVPGVVEDGVAGLITPMGDAHAFAEAVRSLLIDPERRERMGRAARERMVRCHDIALGARTIDRHLRQAVAAFAR